MERALAEEFRLPTSRRGPKSERVGATRFAFFVCFFLAICVRRTTGIILDTFLDKFRLKIDMSGYM